MAHRDFRWTLLASTALIGLATTPGFAQTTKAKSPAPVAAAKSAESTYLSPLVVSAASIAGGIGDPYAKTAAVSSISKDDISQFGGQNIDNVLRTQPGVFTRDNPQNVGVAVNIRGLEGSGRVAMTIDGAKQNFRFTGHEAQGLTYVDPALLAGIDVQRGAAEGAAGAGALAGSANFRTLSVDDLLTDPDKNYGGYLTSSLGNNGDGVAPSGAAAFRVNDTFAVLGALSYRKTFDYQNGLGQTVPFTGQEILSGLAKAEITPSIDQKLTISGVFYRGDFVANSYAQTVYNKTGTVHYDYTPSDNELVDLHANFYVNDTTMLYGKTPGSATGGTAQGRIIDDLGLGLDVTNTSRGALGDHQVASTYGISSSVDNVNVTNSSTSAATGVNPSGVSKLASIYDSTTVTLGPVDLTGGLRYDYFTVDGQASAKAGNALGLPVGTFDVNRAEGRLSPSAKIALNAVDWFQPYVSYAETYRPPTSNELMVGGAHPSTSGPPGPGFVPNPNLRPEVARTVEIGANFTRNGIVNADDSVKVKADVFVSKVDNYVTAMFTPAGDSYFGNNPGTSTITGFELQGGYDAEVFFASLAYTHTATDLPSQVNGFGAQSYLPTDIFTTTLGTRLLEDHSLTLGGRLYAVSQSYVGAVNVSAGQSPYQPGYTLVDLFANYKLQNGIELGANVSNVFNVAYTPALSTTPSLTVPAGRGRTFELTAKAKF